MEERKIASEDGMTFAYRDVREGEKSPWELNGKPIVPVHVPAPNDYQKTDLPHWTNSLSEEDLEFCIQYYYDRWNFAGDSCDEDKRIVDALTEERDNRKEYKKGGGCIYGSGFSVGGGYAYVNVTTYSGAGGTVTISAAGSGGAFAGAGAGGGMVNITPGSLTPTGTTKK